MASLPSHEHMTIGSILALVLAALADRRPPDPRALGHSICTGDIAGLSLVHDFERRDGSDPK
jgi:hypothetical protein